MTDVPGIPHRYITIERFILQRQAAHPQASGELTNLLYDVALAGKLIAAKVIEAGLAGLSGDTGQKNVQGETVMKLDRFADDTMIHMNDHTGRLAIMASEEHDGPIEIPVQYPTGNYVLVFDPLDGSSNVDVNVSVGTIFGVYRRRTPHGRPGSVEDLLQPGRSLVAAGYVIYGSSTMFVYTDGDGVHGFTLNRMVGEFLLSHPDMKIPDRRGYYSVNQGNERYWSPAVQRYTQWLQGSEGGPGADLRYVGSLVADFHRTLLTGGVYYYPADRKDPSKPGGKLRLLYEASPLGFIAEQAGGAATDGRRRVLDLVPGSLHQRTPLFIGARALVEKAGEYVATEKTA